MATTHTTAHCLQKREAILLHKGPRPSNVTGFWVPGAHGISSQLCPLPLLGHPESVWPLNSREKVTPNTGNTSHIMCYVMVL